MGPETREGQRVIPPLTHGGLAAMERPVSTGGGAGEGRPGPAIVVAPGAG